MKKLLSAAVLAVTAGFHGAHALDSLEYIKAVSFSSFRVTLEQPAGIPPPEQPVVTQTANDDVNGRPVSPKPGITPGKLCFPDDEDFDGYRYPEHIAHCARNVSYDMKLQVARDYGVEQSAWKNYEFDHLIPLSVGGSNSTENLWPQPHGEDESHGKDKLENQLYRQLSKGEITRAEAVKKICGWFHDYVEKTGQSAGFRNMLKTRLNLE